MRLRYQLLTDSTLKDVAARLSRLLWDDPGPRDTDGPERTVDGPDGGN